MSEEHVPPRWESMRLGDVVSVKYGSGLTAQNRSGSGPVVVIGSAGPVGTHDEALHPGPAIVIGRKGNAGAAYLSEGPCWPIDTTYFFDIPPLFAPRFLWHQLRWMRLGQLDSSTTIPSLRRDDLEAARVLIPPLDEQRRIVDAIETHLSHLDAGVEGLRRVERSLGRLRAAILQGAVGDGQLGNLADELRDAPVVTIGSIAEVGSGATPLRSRRDYWEGGTIPWVTSGQVNDPVITVPAELITSKALAETSVRVWPKGTLLVAMYGEGKTRGKCSELAIESTVNQACAAIALRPPYEACGAFVKLALSGSYEALRRRSAGGVQPNLNLGVIRSMTIPFPSTETQHLVVERVAAGTSVVGRLFSSIGVDLVRAETLRASVLRAAFVGHLSRRRSRVVM